jgi:hypothetical protein
VFYKIFSYITGFRNHVLEKKAQINSIAILSQLVFYTPASGVFHLYSRGSGFEIIFKNLIFTEKIGI